MSHALQGVIVMNTLTQHKCGPIVMHVIGLLLQGASSHTHASIMTRFIQSNNMYNIDIYLLNRYRKIG